VRSAKCSSARALTGLSEPIARFHTPTMGDSPASSIEFPRFGLAVLSQIAISRGALAVAM
jgi:hypothetical protein